MQAVSWNLVGLSYGQSEIAVISFRSIEAPLGQTYTWVSRLRASSVPLSREVPGLPVLFVTPPSPPAGSWASCAILLGSIQGLTPNCVRAQHAVGKREARQRGDGKQVSGLAVYPPPERGTPV